MDHASALLGRRLRLREGSQALMSTRTSPVTTAIVVQGQLDGHEASDLRDEILHAVDQGVVAITVDLSSVTVVSPEGVETLTVSAELMRNRGAVLVVVARDADGQSLVAAGVSGSARLAALLCGRRAAGDAA